MVRPITGFDLETAQYKNISLITWDIDGNEKVRPLLKQYYTNAKGLIYVVDSNDRGKID